ncbi:cation/H(+) antiporter 15-like [Euphorbia lathyris]|uniref:cation/H(+) antiporter 15-like n=1 Tax=Euphorbia lathyris TaxID=212925 RepID=UPI003313275C
MDINGPQNYYHTHRPENVSFHCYVVNITAEHAYWQDENPLSQALPLLVWQLACVILINRIVFYLLKPFNVPRIVTDILAGILTGPSVLGRTRSFAVIFPMRSITMVETTAYWALTCHLFLTGLEMDLGSLARISKSTIRFAIIIAFLPFILGICLYFMFVHLATNAAHGDNGFIFWAVTLSVTSYPLVARILAQQKLLHTDFGRLALSISIVNELITWILLTILIPAQIGVLNVIYAVAATAGYAAVSVVAVRPCLRYLIRKTFKVNKQTEYYHCSFLVGVSFFALISDMLGTNAIVGAFLFGLIMPDRALATVLLEKFDDFIGSYLMPLFYTAMGKRLDIWSVKNWPVSLFMILICCLVKVASVSVASHFYKMSHKDSFALGVLTSTKGILAVIVLNMGFDKSYLDSDDYVVMVISTVVMTAVVPSIISSIYNPNKRLSNYKLRTIQNIRLGREFRILTCLQSSANALGTINLLDSSNASKGSPLCVFALHLVELTGRASASLIVHTPGTSTNRKTCNFSEQIVNLFETYSNLQDYVAAQPLTALSPFSTMHEDICSVAEDKHVSLLILPFHKLPTRDGNLEEEGSSSFRGVNLHVLNDAPCSVAIFVDRGYGATGESNLEMRKLIMIFLGGPDDREALAYAWRMGAGHGICLEVLRFVVGDAVEVEADQSPIDENSSEIALELIDRQRSLDDEFINHFRLKCAGIETINYEERVARDDEELISTLKELNHAYDLYIVGKGAGMKSPLTSGLMDWCEYPELGALGDLLTTSTFVEGSVLVIQQYTGFGDEFVNNETDMEDIISEDGTGRPDYSPEWRSNSCKIVGGKETDPLATMQKSNDRFVHSDDNV